MYSVKLNIGILSAMWRFDTTAQQNSSTCWSMLAVNCIAWWCCSSNMSMCKSSRKSFLSSSIHPSSSYVKKEKKKKNTTKRCQKNEYWCKLGSFFVEGVWEILRDSFLWQCCCVLRRCTHLLLSVGIDFSTFPHLKLQQHGLNINRPLHETDTAFSSMEMLLSIGAVLVCMSFN